MELCVSQFDIRDKKTRMSEPGVNVWYAWVSETASLRNRNRMLCMQELPIAFPKVHPTALQLRVMQSVRLAAPTIQQVDYGSVLLCTCATITAHENAASVFRSRVGAHNAERTRTLTHTIR